LLTTTHVAHPDLNKAANELLTNAHRLVFAGRFNDARVLLDMLLTPGPWLLSRHGNVVQKLEQLLPIVCYLCDTGCPTIGRSPPRSTEEIAAWAEDQAERSLNSLAMPWRHQLRPAGFDWTEATLQSLADIEDPGARKTAFSLFCIDAEFVLKERLAAQSGHGSSTITLASLMKSLEAGIEPDIGGLNMMQLLSQAPSQIADPARGIATATIGAATIHFLRKTNTPANDITSFIFQAVSLLCLKDGLTSAATEAASCLAGSESGHPYLIGMATLKPIRELLASGACAASVGVDDATIAACLQVVRRRPQFATPGSNPSPFMTDSIAAFTKLLGGTPLAGRKLFELPVLDTPEKAYAMEASLGDMEDLWRIARALVPQTGRWPVITTCWSGGNLPVSKAIFEEDFFSRYGFEEAPNVDDVSPRALLGAVDRIDPDAFIARMEEERDDQLAAYGDFDGQIDDALEDTLRRTGTAPSRQDVKEATIDGRAIETAYQLDRWLLDWEQGHGGSGDPKMARQAWFEPDPVLLLFLPTPHSWDALAYLNWFGTSDFGSEYYIALGRAWEQKFGAELFAHFGTMLECFVSRPPASIQEAWELAQQHDLASSCTLALPGITLRHYATGLMEGDRWFLHERP
jgi:hypothetical protein